MTFIQPIRIEPAFDDAGKVRALFERHAPYRAIAAYAPEGIADQASGEGKPPALPQFRGNWAVGGHLLVEGAELILHNKNFIEAARAAYGTSFVNPEFVVLNLVAPMPAGATHVDIPSFYGATRADYPLPFLRVMGSSGLFETWRVIRASIISWFYDGTGGAFDYWPEGLDGPMLSERPPFDNVALLADTDQMHHRIGPTGNQNVILPRMSASAEIQPSAGGWTILENGEVRASYPSHAIRFSILWKAEVRNREMRNDNLTFDRIMGIFTADLRRRNIEFQTPSDPLADTEWILLLQRSYAPRTRTVRV